MTPVYVVYLARPVTGGWVSFTAHLARGLAAAGYSPQIRKIAKRSERQARPFGMGLAYRNAALADVARWARAYPTVVAAAEPRQSAQLAALAETGAAVVIHDPTELKGTAADAVAQVKDGRLFVVRPAMLAALPQAAWLPHPYQRMAPAVQRRRWHAAAWSRLDWDKHTLTIAQANTLLPPERRVRIWGAENRLYTHHKLDAAVAGWRENYAGPMGRADLWAGARLAGTAGWAVDMSAIKGDGGGTQYTFLEAIDGGAALVINTAWLTGGPADLIAGYATAVNGAEALAGVLSDPPPTPQPAPGLWSVHDAKRVAGQLMETLR